MSKTYTPNGDREVARRLRQGLMTEPDTWKIIKTHHYLYENLKNE